MKKPVLVLTAIAALTGSAVAADLPVAAPYTKAPAMPAPAANWTGFYIFGGAGGGIWDADNNTITNPGALAVTRDQRGGGDGWFGTVGAGYDWQFNRTWVAGIFADGQFGSLRGSLTDGNFRLEGSEKLLDTWAVGVRLGYLVAPNVYSYVNAGYTGSQWSGSSLTALIPFTPGTLTTPSFHRDGFFIGGGFENSLNIFGITAPGWFMKTEYRAAYFGRVTLPETNPATGVPDGFSDTFKPFVQTVSTSLVYRFNSDGGPLAVSSDSAPARAWTKAPVMPVANWTGFYVFGGAGGGVWDADSNVVVSSTGFGLPVGTALARDQRLGGSGWLGTVGAGYDWQFNGRWVAGIMADGQFGDIHGSLSDSFSSFLGAVTEGREKLQTSYAAGVRLGYLVAPNVLSYVNAGYSGSEWSGTSQTFLTTVNLAVFPGTQSTTPSFHRDGFFIGGGVENNLDIFGINMPGLFMKTEYRSAFYDRISLPETFAPGNSSSFTGLTGQAITFKPWVQTITTSLVYRFNWSGPVVAKY